MFEPVCVAERRNLLGEGPCWDAGSGRLYWLDIKGRRLEWLDPVSGDIGGHDLDLQPSACAPRRAGTLLLATDAGFAVCDPATGPCEIRRELEPHPPHNRTNDGTFRPMGRFWVGTMDDREQACSGSVYRLDADWVATGVLTDIAIPNTLVCSPSGDTLYVADSKAGRIWAYDLDLERGALGARRLFADTREDGCAPDGSAVDCEGRLWNAQWGGWRVVCYRPDGGVEHIVPMPVEQPTSCAFGGPDLDTLYITSARIGLDSESLAEQPLAGGLFAFRPGVRGAPHPPFAG